MHHDGKNPYTQASNAYGAVDSETDQRSLEARLLLKAALKLETLATRLTGGEKVHREEIGDIFDYNQKLWQVFVNETINEDHALPQELKNNIASLGIFVFKRTLDVLADTQPQKIQVLVNINRNIAAGLMQRLHNTAGAALSPPGLKKDPAIPDILKDKADHMA